MSIAALCLAVLIAGGFAWRHARANRPLSPLQIGYWYWHRPFRLAPGEIKALAEMGVSRLYIHAVTFHLHDGALEPVMPQQYLTAAGGEDVTLVQSFDYDIVRAFPSLPNAALENAVVGQAELSRQAAVSAGLKVTGIQLDLDCPTSRLPKYAALLRGIRPRLRRSGLSLSITALPTWLTSREILPVMDAVDDTAPQFYEGRTPRSYSRLCTISNLDGFAAGLRRAGDTGRPFYAGIPAYGHALVFDGSQKFIGLYHDLDAPDAVRDPLFHYVKTYPSTPEGALATKDAFTGEEMVDLLAPPRGPDGAPCHLVYDLPTPALVARHIAWIRRHRPPNCRGIILFRYPGVDEADTVPLAGAASALRGAEAHPRLIVEVRKESDPWATIETGRAQAKSVRLRLRITNAGEANTPVLPGAVTVSLQLGRPGVTQVERGGFDSVETLLAPAGAGGEMRPASAQRADTIRFTAHFLAAGQTMTTGPIDLDPAGPETIQGRWAVSDTGEFNQITGDFHAATID